MSFRDLLHDGSDDEDHGNSSRKASSRTTAQHLRPQDPLYGNKRNGVPNGAGGKPQGSAKVVNSFRDDDDILGQFSYQNSTNSYGNTASKKGNQNGYHQGDREDYDDDQDDETKAKQYANQITEVIREVYNGSSKVKGISDKIGTNKDTHELRKGLAETIIQTNTSAKRGTKYFEQIAALASREERQLEKKATTTRSGSMMTTSYGTSASQATIRALLNKLKNEFDDAFKHYQKVATTAKEREKKYTAQEKQNLKKSQKQNYQPQDMLHDSSADSSQEDEAAQQRQALLQKKREEDEIIFQRVEHNESLIAERESDIREIESSVVEISDIFKELNILVNDQGENIQIIADFVEETEGNVKNAVKDLGTAEKYDKKGRNLLCLLLLLILGIGIAVAIVLVVVLKVVIKF